jgi:hypothetical protein
MCKRVPKRLQCVSAEGRLSEHFRQLINVYYYYYYYYLFTANGLSAGGSSATLAQTKIKVHKTTITTKNYKT